MSKFINFFVIGLLFLNISICAAQPNLNNSVNIKINVHKLKVNEKRSQEAGNIYMIEVQPTSNTSVDGQYNILYYIDDRYISEFKDVALPYSFKRNFKGFSKGVHVIQVELETTDGVVISSDRANIVVKK